jgi:hypothetical protein
MYKLRDTLCIDQSYFDKKPTAQSRLPAAPLAVKKRPAVKKKAESDDADCGICCCAVSSDSIFSCPGGHSLCSDCLGTYVGAELDKVEGNTNLKLEFGSRSGSILCPHHYVSGCSHSFEPADLAPSLSKDKLRKLWSLNNECIAAHEFSKSAAEAQKKLDGMGIASAAAKKKFDHEQLEASLRLQFGGSAYQCKECSFGPILRDGCTDLNAHHNQQVGRAKINNGCPECGWFASNIREWPSWNGKIRDVG